MANKTSEWLITFSLGYKLTALPQNLRRRMANNRKLKITKAPSTASKDRSTQGSLLGTSFQDGSGS